MKPCCGISERKYYHSWQLVPTSFSVVPFLVQRGQFFSSPSSPSPLLSITSPLSAFSPFPSLDFISASVHFPSFHPLPSPPSLHRPLPLKLCIFLFPSSLLPPSLTHIPPIPRYISPFSSPPLPLCALFTLLPSFHQNNLREARGCSVRRTANTVFTTGGRDFPECPLLCLQHGRHTDRHHTAHEAHK